MTDRNEPPQQKERRPDVRLEHGWVTPAGYICDGCAVREAFEHRCHGSDGGPSCVCPECKSLTDESERPDA